MNRASAHKGRSLAKNGPHGNEEENDGSGIQQAAGLIRYFDEESEESWKITPAQVYLACILWVVSFTSSTKVWSKRFGTSSELKEPESTRLAGRFLPCSEPLPTPLRGLQ